MPNAPQASAPGKQCHPTILGTLGAHGGQVKRERERDMEYDAVFNPVGDDVHDLAFKIAKQKRVYKAHMKTKRSSVKPQANILSYLNVKISCPLFITTALLYIFSQQVLLSTIILSNNC